MRGPKFIYGCAIGTCFAFSDPHKTDSDQLFLLQLQARQSNVIDGQCPTKKIEKCGGVGDTHLKGHWGPGEAQTAGLMPVATHCNGDHVQFYQCYFRNGGLYWASSIKGYAAKFGDTVVRVLTLEGRTAQVCIASLDGCKSLDHYVGDDRLQDLIVQRYQNGVRLSRPSTGWAVWHEQHSIGDPTSYFDAFLTAPSARNDTDYDVCLNGGTNYASMTWTYADDPATPNYEGILFAAEDMQKWCQTCLWPSSGKNKCLKPPPAPPPPKPEDDCKAKGFDFNKAIECCLPVEGDPSLYEDCLYDYCVDGNKDVCTAYELVEGSEGRPICLTDKATDNCPKPPAQVCANSAKLDLTNVVENNLEVPGGRLVYGRAGTINGKTVDVVVTAAEGYTPFMGGAGNNGNAGEFGTINVACGTEAEMTFTIVETGTNNPEAIEFASLTYYDLDEGKRGKGRMTVETCDQDETIIAENTELSQVVRGTCVAVTSSQKGNEADNPTSLMELDDIQRARAVTYTFSKLSRWKSKVSLARGSGGRSFLFSLQPAEACRPGVNLVALGWVPPKPDEKEVPEDRKICTKGGCPLGEGCCMDKSWFVAQSWARPNETIRDSCLSLGMNWCTSENEQQTRDFIIKRDGGLKYAISPAMTFLMKVGMFAARPRLKEAVREQGGAVPQAAFPELAKYESLGSKCISGQIGGYNTCTSGTYRDESCQEQAAAACAAKKGCKNFAFLVRRHKGAAYELGKKSGRSSEDCLGWTYKGDF